MTACRECVFCNTLYSPPDANKKAKYEYCCTLFVTEGRVMKLDNIDDGRCECFEKKNKDSEDEK